MKRFILSIFTICLIFSFTACGDNADKSVTESDLETWTEKDFEDALLALDSADTSSDTQNQNPTAGDFYEAKPEIISAAWDSGLIQINDTLIQLPIHLNEWVDKGLDYEVDYGKKSKDYLFNSGDMVYYSLILNGDTISSLFFKKETEGFETLEDMNPLIESIEVTWIWKPEHITMYFPGGLTFDDPYDSIEKSLGKATNVGESLTYMYGIDEHSSTDIFYGTCVHVNRDSQTISGFKVGKGLPENNREDLTIISFEDVPNIQTSDTHNVTLLWVPEYKQVPWGLNADRSTCSVLNYNGQKYFVSLSFSMLAQKYANPYEYNKYGDPVLDLTDESGMSRTVYRADSSYIIVCSTDEHIFKASIAFENMTDSSEDALTALQDLVIEIANSVQY